jgi:hypothetical protein
LPLSGEPTGCVPEFAYEDGWLGGDAAYSVPLGDGRTLWLFGDSFVASRDQPDRQGSAFVHNSVGVSRCSAAGFDIDYAWGRAADGSHAAFLERPGGGWWWLFDGFTHAGQLYLGLLEVEHAEPSGPLSMPFAFSGVQLARVANPDDPPSEWRTDVVSLSADERAFPASAFVVDGDSLYLFTFVSEAGGRYPRGLARVPLAALDGTATRVDWALESLASDGRWKPGIDASDLRILMNDTATEMSVHFHPAIGKWLALYNYPEVGDDFPAERPSDVIWVRTAAALKGPWSEPRAIHRIAELSPESSNDPNTGCYAAKEHPQFSAQRLTVTYVCNLFTGPGEDPNQILRRLLRDMSLYRPVTVRLDLPRELRDLPHAGPR